MKHKILVHPMVTTVIQTGIANLDGSEYVSAECCPSCGGELAGYDKKRKYFASLQETGGVRDIHVVVKRFRCRSCGRLVSANSPFYPGTRIGAPVVDLCVTLSEEMSWSRAASVIHALGIVIDRGSVRNYVSAGFPPVESTEVFGFRLPVSILSLSMSNLGIVQPRPVIRAEPFIPGGFPPADRAPLHRSLFDKRHEGNKQKDEEKRPSE
jgi:hypothetical protein